MKKLLLTSIIGLASGIAGAFIFNVLHQNQDNILPYEVNLSNTKSNVDPNIIQLANRINQLENSSFTSNNNPKGGKSLPLNFIKASDNSRKSVVYIKTYEKNQYRRQSWADLFFGGRGQTYEKNMQMGSGSGVIFSNDGFIVTNNHVIKGADKVEVIYNRRSYVAKVIGVDTSSDIALIKIEENDMPAITIASSKDLAVGDWVLAVGNPFNLTSTVTAGIVSAKGRRINIMKDMFPLESFIQTDAAINPGNSGGALVNVHGELVGINTAILSRTGSYAGYGFAVPSDIVAKIVNDLKHYGAVQKAFLGAEVLEVNEEIYKKLSLPSIEGVVLTKIQQGGAAEKSGMKTGDLIISINNSPIQDQAMYNEFLSYHNPGDEIELLFYRDKELKRKSLTLTNIDGTTDIAKKELYEAENIGAIFESLPTLEKSKLGLKSGIRVNKIERGGLINRMRIKEGMVIISVNNYPINRPEDFTYILERVQGRVLIEVMTNSGRVTSYLYSF
ncbi:S1C family serine protease [Sediminitomix flava]|uniref:Do/DeqQ family serine protease n=1 Tax=Sediminitomix flava TaxID=379075 RepID=A0A315Z7V5_SEDFL|nr:trypsin-like peptidase domain-containing protein [Sediminitomix flava]PWJ40826.1 Do/DeqQ family serine protease [Sediminitomix flava]